MHGQRDATLSFGAAGKESGETCEWTSMKLDNPLFLSISGLVVDPDYTA